MANEAAEQMVDETTGATERKPNEKVSGKVEKTRRDGKGIMVNDVWYTINEYTKMEDGIGDVNSLFNKEVNMYVNGGFANAVYLKK